jgi:hypothetical protein
MGTHQILIVYHEENLNFFFFGAGILAHHQNRQTSNSFKLFEKQDQCITKLTEKKQKNALHVVMCKYYSSYMVIIYARSSKQAAHGG